MAAAPDRRDARLDFLDGLRGGAILAVYLFHALGPSFGADALTWDGWHRVAPLSLRDFLLLPAYLGWAGVAVFFVVSGFCIHLTHQRSGEHGFRRFFLRRFFRIYPPFVVAVLLFALVLPGTRLDFHVHHNLGQLLSHLLLIHNNLGPGFLYGINPAFWSIGVEVQLYLLYPALLLLVRWLGWSTALGSIGGLEVVLRFGFAFFSPHAPIRLWLLGDPFLYWFSWTLGAWLCHRWLTGKLLSPPSFTLWLWPTLAVASYFFQPTYGFGFLFWALATTALLSRFLSVDQRPGILSHPLLRRAGLVSYSVYLLHQPLLNLIGAQLPRGFLGLGGCLVALPLILTVAAAFYLLVEQPAIAAGKWFVRRLNFLSAPAPHFSQGIAAPASRTA